MSIRLISRWCIEHFGTVDLRALGAFRIALGTITGLDIVRRWQDLDLFYTNNGFLSNHYTLFLAHDHAPLSFLLALGGPWEVRAFFAGALLASLALALGIKTRWAHACTLLLWHSIMSRNFMTIYGGDSVLLALHVIAIFLPLGLRYSLDAVWANGSRARDDAGARSHGYRSLGALALLLQICGIYFITAYAKHGPTWQSGDVLYYLLHQDRVVTDLGHYFGSVAPVSVLRLMTRGALAFEWIAPCLIILPVRSPVPRLLGFGLLASFHTAVFALTHIRLFSVIMIMSYIPLLPPQVWDTFERILGRGRIPATSSCEGAYYAQSFGLAQILREGVLAIGIVLGTWMALGRNVRLSETTGVSFPPSFVSTALYFSYFQSWQMFAPDIGRHDFHVVIDVLLEDGSRIDPITGRPPDFSQSHRTTGRFSQHWQSYASRIQGPEGRNLFFELERWVFERWGPSVANPARRPRTLTVYVVRDLTPEPNDPDRAPKTSEVIELWKSRRNIGAGGSEIAIRPGQGSREHSR